MTGIDLKPKIHLLQWTEEDVVKILEQFDRKPEDLKADVTIIRDWLKTQPHLPSHPSDNQIVFFLISNKFSFEKTKSKLEMSYTIKSIVPEYFSAPPIDPRIETVMNSYNLVMLPQLSKDCHRVIISKCQNPDTFDFRDFINLTASLYELRAMYGLSISDDYIIDMQNINLTFISKINIVEFKKIVILWENVYSIRIGALHVLNLPPAAAGFLNLVIGLLKEKIQGRVHFHKSVEDLWEFYPKDMLPKELGGTKPLQEFNREWLELLKANNDYLEGFQKARIVESLRPKKLENDEFFGFHGNFRKLQID